MNKITLSSILLLLCASFSTNSMFMDLDLCPQTRFYNNNTLNIFEKNNLGYFERSSLIAGFCWIGMSIIKSILLASQSLKNEKSQPSPNTNLLWIETSDNKTFLMDIKKNLPACGLQFLLKKYNRMFGHHNTKQTPLKTGCSLSDYQLLGAALNIIDHDIPQWNFTKREQITLLDIASCFKILNLYLALIDPGIQANIFNTNQDINKKLTPLLSTLTNKVATTSCDKIKKFATRSLKHIHNSQKQTTKNLNHYIRDNSFYHAETNECIIKIPKDIKRITILNKEYILFSNTKKNILFIYDITHKKRHYLPITSLKGCHNPQVSPDKNYITTFSDMNSDGKYDESLIYIWNISDLNNINGFYILSHPGVNQLIFNPNSTALVSAAHNNSVELWNLADLPNKNITSITLLMNEKINKITFNKDGKTLAINHSSDVFTHRITLIDTETLHQQTVFCLKKHPSFLFPDNSDFILYATCDKELQEFIFKIITKEGKEIYSKKLEENNIADNSITLVISNNNQYIAMNSLYTNQFDILTIDDSCNVTTATINEYCDYINNDGSFYTHTSHEIRLYDKEKQKYTTLHDDRHKLLSAVKIIPDKNSLKYSYYSDVEPRNKSYRQLLDAKTDQNIKAATEEITPLQYMLINKACGNRTKHNKPMPIKQNSLDHHTLQTFGEHTELITKTLELQITDK